MCYDCCIIKLAHALTVRVFFSHFNLLLRSRSDRNNSFRLQKRVVSSIGVNFVKLHNITCEAGAVKLRSTNQLLRVWMKGFMGLISGWTLPVWLRSWFLYIDRGTTRRGKVLGVWTPALFTESAIYVFTTFILQVMGISSGTLCTAEWVILCPSFTIGPCPQEILVAPLN